MEHDFQMRLEQIIGEMECPKDFRCYKQGFENLCKAKDVGPASHLVCCEEHPSECHFSWDYGPAYFCTCPVRIYIAKKLKK
jgi:hypothetical protein